MRKLGSMSTILKRRLFTLLQDLTISQDLASRRGEDNFAPLSTCSTGISESRATPHMTISSNGSGRQRSALISLLADGAMSLEEVVTLVVKSLLCKTAPCKESIDLRSFLLESGTSLLLRSTQ